MVTPTRPTSSTEPPDWSTRIPRRAAEAHSPVLKAFYGSGAAPPDTPLSQVPFVALDLETTGLDAEQHSILSIGLVPFTLARIPLAGARHWLVKPDRPLSEDSILIHHITHEAIQQAPPIQDILPTVLDQLAGRIVVVHYRAIERRFLHQASTTCFNEVLEFPVVDTMDLEARVYRKPSSGFFNRLLGRQSQPIRLSDARARFNLPFYPPHDALTDAVATAELLQAQVAHRFSPETPIATLWR